jgi:hypothetical protein
MSTGSTTKFTVPLRILGKLTVSDLVAKLISLYKTYAAYICCDPKGDVKRSTVSRASIRKQCYKQKLPDFQKRATLSRLVVYIQSGQLRHNCPSTNFISWHLQNYFRHLQHIQLRSGRLRSSTSKTCGYI